MRVKSNVHIFKIYSNSNFLSVHTTHPAGKAQGILKRFYWLKRNEGAVLRIKYPVGEFPKCDANIRY